MKSLPKLHWMPRVRSDLSRLYLFVARQRWGNPDERLREIIRGMRVLRENPLRNSVRSRRPRAGLEYRRHNVAQFAIVYVYLKPCDALPHGMVSIRAIQHSQMDNVLWQVRERGPPAPQTQGAALRLAHRHQPFAG